MNFILLALPGAPTGVRITDQKPDSVNLTWNPPTQTGVPSGGKPLEYTMLK